MGSSYLVIKRTLFYIKRNRKILLYIINISSYIEYIERHKIKTDPEKGGKKEEKKKRRDDKREEKKRRKEAVRRSALRCRRKDFEREEDERERERERRVKRETRRFEIFVRRDITLDDDARRPPRAC